ncbi:CDP-diacylglycerol pyrophosphatase [Komagataeibacter saccharivorans]|uniref:CDP-diacylglycerol diphosphatase n=1 Tax=Komagataeibacter saccharivorans TaxID=265959 RepID=UPI00104992A3|nr:CDP-diacylglycerol diphosphatase [Komagataeibacter saccharivorans]QBL92737.1 CDP-diacylglycerol pyrophosphatase [Komagataeibacter saccharivorans]
MKGRVLIAVALAVAACGTYAVRAAVNPDALWQIVHERCTPGATTPGQAIPCAEVDTRAGYAVLKDRVGVGQYLLIPTQRITGMEDPALLRDDLPDYFDYAWRQTRRLNGRLARPLPADDMMLAINSAYGRSQNQLHIHVDCMRTDVKVALHWAVPHLGPDWTPLPLHGHAYRARLIRVASLSGVRPFSLLAHDLADPGREMGQHTLIVAGVVQPDGQPGFVVLDDHVDPRTGDRAAGEELQDHACQLQHMP